MRTSDESVDRAFEALSRLAEFQPLYGAAGGNDAASSTDLRTVAHGLRGINFAAFRSDAHALGEAISAVDNDRKSVTGAWNLYTAEWYGPAADAASAFRKKLGGGSQLVTSAMTEARQQIAKGADALHEQLEEFADTVENACPRNQRIAGLTIEDIRGCLRAEEHLPANITRAQQAVVDDRPFPFQPAEELPAIRKATASPIAETFVPEKAKYQVPIMVAAELTARVLLKNFREEYEESIQAVADAIETTKKAVDDIYDTMLGGIELKPNPFDGFDGLGWLPTPTRPPSGGPTQERSPAPPSSPGPGSGDSQRGPGTGNQDGPGPDGGPDGPAGPRPDAGDPTGPGSGDRTGPGDGYRPPDGNRPPPNLDVEGTVPAPDVEPVTDGPREERVTSALDYATYWAGQDTAYVGGGTDLRYGLVGDGSSTQFREQSEYLAPEGVVGFDCSGLVAAMYRQVGVDMSGIDSSGGMADLPYVANDDLQPGDLLVKPNSHVAVYLGDTNGNGSAEIVEASPHDEESRDGYSRGVRIHDAATYLDDPEYTGRRIPDDRF